MRDNEDGLGGNGRGKKGLAVDQPWNNDEVDETTGASILVQDQPSGRQISLPPRILASSSSSSSSSSSRRCCEVAPKFSPTEPTDRLLPGMDVAKGYQSS